MCDPDSFEQIKRFHTLWEGLTDDDSDFCLGGPLIVAKFGQPAVAPIFGALGFPSDSPTGLTERADDPL